MPMHCIEKVTVALNGLVALVVIASIALKNTEAYVTIHSHQAITSGCFHIINISVHHSDKNYVFS